VALLINRSVSGVAPVVDASSGQSRVDVLVIALAATLALTGFQWLALKPVERKRVPPRGRHCHCPVHRS
jgi:Cofactor assembly of complex C subunit B, CCB2/CCB4